MLKLKVYFFVSLFGLSIMAYVMLFPPEASTIAIRMLSFAGLVVGFSQIMHNSLNQIVILEIIQSLEKAVEEIAKDQEDTQI